MSDHAAFLKAIVAAPDDDLPRLIYADWLDERGDPRGEFIRKQIELEQLEEDDPRRAALAERCERLLQTHEQVWQRCVADWTDECVFRRGFVESVSLSWEEYRDCADELLAATPIRRLHIRSMQTHGHPFPADPAAFAGLARLNELSLCGCTLDPAWGRRFVDPPAKPALRRLELSAVSGLNHELLRFIRCSFYLRWITSLDLSHNSIACDSLGFIGEHNWKELTDIDLSYCDLSITHFEPLLMGRAWGFFGPPKLQRLEIAGNRLHDDGIIHFSRWHHWRNTLHHTRRLDLSRTSLGPRGMQALAESNALKPLRQLKLDHNAIGSDGLIALTVTDLPHLHTLRLQANDIDEAGAFALADSELFRQLRVLDLRDNHISTAGAEALMYGDHRPPGLRLDLSGNRPLRRRQRGDEPIAVDFVWGED